MYLALYRKFRPKTFDQVVGQDHIIRTLKNQIKNNQIGHAYLFCGSRGTGKTSVAKIFAKAVNCQNPQDGSPCGECEVCKSLALSNNMDIIEIDAASNNRVDEVRDLRDKVKFAPMSGRFKVYIIDEVHMLTDSAFNALLKTLEEPPEHIIFVLATTEPQKLPATILSRVLRFDFRLVDQTKLENLLKSIFVQIGLDAEEDAVTEIAKAGNGSVRDALSVADMCASYADKKLTAKDVLQVLGASNFEVLSSLCASVLSGNINQFLNVFSSEVNAGKNILSIAQSITKTFRDILVLKSGGISSLVSLSENEKKTLFELAKNSSLAKINVALQAFSKIEQELKFATFPQLLVETTAIDVCLKNQNSTEQNIQKTQEMQTNVAENEQNSQNAPSPTPHRIWGQVLLDLNETNVVLHAMCVQLSNVELDGANFLIDAQTDSIFEMLKKSENYAFLVASFQKLGYNYNIKIVQTKAEEKPDKAKLISEKLGLSVNKK